MCEMQTPRTTPTAPAVDHQPAPLRAHTLPIRTGRYPARAAVVTVAAHLGELHFTAQHEAAKDLRDAQITQLDSFLRSVLFTDGTVSRQLEAHTLRRVAVETVEQAPNPAPTRIARYLHVQP